LADEKVLDIPAVDMTDAALAAKATRVQARKPKIRAKKASPKRNATRPATPRKRDGSIGRATYEAVNKLIADGAATKQAAFAAYGKQTKTQPGTVAANYYRVARAEGAAKPRKRRVTARSGASRASVASAQLNRRSRATRSAGSDLDATLSALVSSIEDLASALKQEQAETAELRRRLNGLRSLV